METAPTSSLPKDVDALHALVAAKDAELYAQGLLIEKLKAQIARAKRKEFGTCSESLEQLELLTDALETDRAQARAAEQNAAPNEAKAHPKRKPLSAHLPREDEVHLPDTDCAQCGHAMRQMGEDVREVLDYVPGRFVVRRHVRPKLSCRDCGTIVQAPMPSLPIERGLAGPGLLAHVLVSKYCDHSPLHRQADIYAREDVDLSRSTLAGWVGQSAHLLRPLIAQLEKHVLAGESIHTDDTPVPVLAPGTGKTKTGRLWTYVRDERPYGSDTPPAVFYRYSPDRKAKRPRDHLKDYRGFLHADGYAGYDQLYGNDIKEVACMAHVRRKFFDIARATASPIATEAVERIAALYQIEKQIRGAPPDTRKAIRQENAKPLFKDLQTWLETTLVSVPGRSELAKVIRYAIVSMRRMTPYLEDGRCALDNNAAERSVRGIALGKKNYLFTGSDKGGQRAAAIYSLIETAKLNDVNPQAWLTYVLCLRKLSSASLGYAMSSPMAAMLAINSGRRCAASVSGQSTLSSDRIRRMALRCCPDAGSSSARWHG